MSTNPLLDHPVYTPDYCEGAYNNLAVIPDHAQYSARWSEDSRLARHLQSAQLNLYYGDDPQQTLDFFPSRKPGAPLLVFIHGGYWRAQDKRNFSFIARPFVARGAAVAVVNYGLAPATPLDEIVRQMLRAHAWLYRRAEELCFDAGRIVTSGHSAGGHLAAMMLAAQWDKVESGLPARLVSGALATSGLYDLEPVAMAPFLKSANITAEQVRAASPAYFKLAHALPLVTAVGDAEIEGLKWQTQLIARCWPRNVRRNVAVAGNHLDICDVLADPGSQLFKAACELLGL